MLELRNLTCGYDSKFCLKNITLKVKSGEFVGIIGPNGSGKTTLLRAITNVIKAKKGDVFFENENIGKMNNKELAKRIAVVSQTPDAGFQMTVEEFISLGRIPHLKKWQFIETKLDAEVAYNAMEMVGIPEFKNRIVSTLSGGEQQLAVIARALTQEPKLLLLDEPTNHLDIAHQVKILDLIKRFNKEKGLTVIVVLHDLNLASEYCDKLLLLNEGSVHAKGLPQEVLTYSTIEEVFRTVVVVKVNPVSSKPHVFLVPQKKLR